jgi:hypothetical protein
MRTRGWLARGPGTRTEIAGPSGERAGGSSATCSQTCSKLPSAKRGWNSRGQVPHSCRSGPICSTKRSGAAIRKSAVASTSSPIDRMGHAGRRDGHHSGIAAWTVAHAGPRAVRSDWVVGAAGWWLEPWPDSRSPRATNIGPLPEKQILASAHMLPPPGTAPPAVR